MMNGRWPPRQWRMRHNLGKSRQLVECVVGHDPQVFRLAFATSLGWIRRVRSIDLLGEPGAKVPQSEISLHAIWVD